MNKKIISALILSAVITFAACKAKQKTADATPTPAPVATTESLLTVAQKKYPAITQADLDEGQKIYSVDCVKCHGAKKLVSRDEEKWTKVIDWMAPKAKLNDQQKLKVLQYVLSARATAIQNKEDK